MNENISWNFNTWVEEIKAVKCFLMNLWIDIEWCVIKKFWQDVYWWDTNAQTAWDVYVKFNDKTFLLFEIKEESLKRILKYNELWIDFISVFKFKKWFTCRKWIYSCDEYKLFIQSIDIADPNFKWGKIANSLSDIWLFYCKDVDWNYLFLDWYDFRKLKDAKFFQYLRSHCQFAVNNKSSDQLSYNDSWCSATFFIKRDKLERYGIKSKDDLYHDWNFTELAKK